MPEECSSACRRALSSSERPGGGQLWPEFDDTSYLRAGYIVLARARGRRHTQQRQVSLVARFRGDETAKFAKCAVISR
jgi:hypothetical protein